MELSAKPPTVKGPGETFTGDVWVDPITRGLPASQLNVAAVRFTPGARSAWHSHAGGQTLYVTEGRGLVQVATTTLSSCTQVTSCTPLTAKSTGTGPPPTTS